MKLNLNKAPPGSLLKSIHNSTDFCTVYLCITRRTALQTHNILLFCSTRMLRSQITQTFEEPFDDQIMSVLKTDNE
jgi:hypothetical protein